MAGLTRNLERRLDELLMLFPAVAIIGVRQCGKTELSRRVRPDWRYLDFEQESVYERVASDPEFFFRQNSGALILDEAQELPKMFKALRGAIDSDRKTTNRFIITGSASPELVENLSESLAGRVATLELGTLKANEVFEKPLSKLYAPFRRPISKDSFRELSVPALSHDQLQRSWLLGGYPEPVTHSDQKFWSIWMNDYRARYVERDIRKLFPKLDIVRFRRFISVLSNTSGNVVVKRDLAAAVEVSEPTIRDYIDIAHGTFVWRKLANFSRTTKKQVTKAPKGYFRDSGLLHHILRIENLEALTHHPALGRSFESFVSEEIIKGLNAEGIVNWTPHFYRTKTKLKSI